tara:strand:- start:506033 stop:506521 length:489 start_codon:yes stop_codon:yes gene_type:complete
MTVDIKSKRDDTPLTATETAIEGRVYVHDTCGQMTRISGKEMVALCDPFQYVARTTCSGCDTRDIVSRFRWRDSGESISSFRRRMRDEAPVFCKIWIMVVAPLTASIIGIDLVRQIRIFAELPENWWIEIPLGILLITPLFCRFIAPKILQALIQPSFHQQK